MIGYILIIAIAIGMLFLARITKKMFIAGLVCLVGLIICSITHTFQVYAISAPIAAQAEVAIQLHQDDLTDALNNFAFSQDSQERIVFFLDTPDLDFYNSGWTIRFRKKEGKDEYEIAYKYRGEEAILPKAILEYDLSGEKQILSQTYEKKYPTFTRGEETLPNLNQIKEMLLAYLPEPLISKKALIDKCVIHSNVSYLRYTGEFLDEKIFLEVWPLDERFVEISFKKDSVYEAEKAKDVLISTLLSKNIRILKNNNTKTALALRVKQ